MNNNKIQQEILKALLANPENVKHFDYFDSTGEERVLLTVTGAVGYILDTDTLRVSLTGAQYMNNPHLDELIKPANRLNGTDDYRKGGTARRYTRDNDLLDDVYVDQGLLKLFTLPKLYQDPRTPLGVIAVTEDRLSDGEDVLVGFVMPIRVDLES